MRVPRALAFTILAACTSQNPPSPDAHVSDAHRVSPDDAAVATDAPDAQTPVEAGVDAPPDAPPDAVA
jgi:hypothetical protein